MELLHPNGGVTLEDLARRLSALEKQDNGFALRGGSAVTYDADGRIATLVAGTISGQVVNAQIASIAFAKITDVSITNAMITSLNASKIDAGTLSANRIAAASIGASKLDVSELSAITANLGTVTAGAINGLTITGGTLRTASSGQRVVIAGADNDITFYDSNGVNCGYIWGGAGQLRLTGASYVALIAGDIVLDGYISTTNTLAMAGHSIVQAGMVAFNTRSSFPGDNWALFAYSSGGTYEIGGKINDDNVWIDRHAA